MLKYLIVFNFIFVNVLYSAMLPYNKAEVRLLNKLTGKYEEIILESDKAYVFDNNLYLMLRICYKSSQEDEVNNVGFLQVVKKYSDTTKSTTFTKDLAIPEEFKIKRDENYNYGVIFSGWLSSTSPSLNFVKDSAYDVTLVGCKVN